MGYAYSTQMTENSARAVGIALPISRKQSIMICQAIRGLNVQKAKKFLEDVVAMKKAVPFTRYNTDTGHKAGMAAGQFPTSACKQILIMLKNAEANAQFKGLSTGNLIIRHASAQKGPTTMRYGRRQTKAKRTHVELVLEEVKEVAKKVRPVKSTEAKK